jgi:hypothetical protein
MVRFKEDIDADISSMLTVFCGRNKAFLVTRTP